MSHIYIGTGGYADCDLLGTVYPLGTAKADFLTHYCRHYDTVEINSSFHAPIGQKAIQGMLEKSDGKLQFSIKLHQDFSHTRIATRDNAKQFLNALQPLVEQQVLAALFLQFPHRFERLFIYLQNTTQSHSFYNIATLKNLLLPFGFEMKTQIDEIPHQQWDLF
ncbi:hypothetical protein BKK56_03835 [Rodentibacter genomosp. 2]|uniref:DUF72 domain-containing protein n=1 Tax=Rodentibacter genomosp. 2 TaxID=1908266 RepID=UPI0009855C24|nr:hypothetical protein BKK56_03835 [Rodentibacter genomosp. 2]